ncbi:YqcC family protein [Phocoenobacter atlanticus]|uniref:YqcC family protein n=1 Tax=Phocoenobacter atlanticus TaxID=3416742 RepID=UPI00274C03A5|nr:YqcC family protein [Pasteurella atlantica]MDP8101172.1 YqcC family protein [Pasteurella atlantica]
MKTQIRQHLNELQIVMQLHHLWESISPSPQDLANDQPFCIGTLSATQWLQWVFIPRINALLDANAELPVNFSITPYLEEALKNEKYLTQLCEPIQHIEKKLSR